MNIAFEDTYDFTKIQYDSKLEKFKHVPIIALPKVLLIHVKHNIYGFLLTCRTQFSHSKLKAFIIVIIGIVSHIYDTMVFFYAMLLNQ